MVKRAFALALRFLRREKRHTQESLSLKCDIDLSYYQGLESGSSAASLATLFKLGEGLQVSPASLAASTEVYIRALVDPTSDTSPTPEPDKTVNLAPCSISVAIPDPRRISQAMGMLIRTLRADTRDRQDHLATRGRVSRDYLSHIECGRGNPTLIILRRLGEALWVDAQALIQGVEVLVNSKLCQSALETWLHTELGWTFVINGFEHGQVFALDAQRALQAALARCRHPDAAAMHVRKT